ncbi:MAG: hypothetical protein Q7R41_16375 [Phycisphaerales bacterium]|jgi:hypothetical protein|nr:hypothetical protein [Phycisphaerales bacterium]
MPRDTDIVIGAAEAVLAEQNTELRATRARQLLAVGAKAATGNGNIDAAFFLDVRFRLVFIRCHFAGTAGTAAIVLSLDSMQGSAYDAKLFTITRAGVGNDVNFRIPADESLDPSPWTFQVGDAVRIQWTNPDSGNITWGLEVGLAMAS